MLKFNFESAIPEKRVAKYSISTCSSNLESFFVYKEPLFVPETTLIVGFPLPYLLKIYFGKRLLSGIV